MLWPALSDLDARGPLSVLLTPPVLFWLSHGDYLLHHDYGMRQAIRVLGRESCVSSWHLPVPLALVSTLQFLTSACAVFAGGVRVVFWSALLVASRQQYIFESAAMWWDLMQMSASCRASPLAFSPRFVMSVVLLSLFVEVLIARRGFMPSLVANVESRPSARHRPRAMICCTCIDDIDTDSL